MSRHPDFVPQGVIPAVLLPFHEDLSIDEPSFRSHLCDVGSVQGLSAITINAHSTEVASCSEDEQRRVMEIAGEEVGDTLPIIHGVWADGSLETARIARRAQAGGASALLVFPPAPFALGQPAAMALAHFRTVADATDLPLAIIEKILVVGADVQHDGQTVLRANTSAGRIERRACRPGCPCRARQGRQGRGCALHR